MKETVLFLDQQSWKGGAQEVLETTLKAITQDYSAIVALPGAGPFQAELVRQGLETMATPIGDYSPGRKSVWETVAFAGRSLVCGLKLARVVHKRGIALIYINGPRLLPAGVLAAALTRRPAILHLQLLLDRRMELLLVTHMARYVSKIVACSQAVANSVGDDRSIAAKTRVVYNPLRRSGQGPFAKSVARGKDDPIMIGAIGRITPRKGQHLLIQAVGRLPSELRNNVRLLIVGDPAPGCSVDAAYLERLRNEAMNHGLSDRITWAGHQTDPGPFYSSMDVLVHASLSEAMCMVILEALDRGIPVIASRVGGIPELVRDGINGLFVTPNDANALCEALRLFLSNRRLRLQLEEGARTPLSAQFSSLVFGPAILGIIREAVEGNARQTA